MCRGLDCCSCQQPHTHHRSTPWHAQPGGVGICAEAYRQMDVMWDAAIVRLEVWRLCRLFLPSVVAVCCCCLLLMLMLHSVLVAESHVSSSCHSGFCVGSARPAPAPTGARRASTTLAAASTTTRCPRLAPSLYSTRWSGGATVAVAVAVAAAVVRNKEAMGKQ